MGHRDGLVRRVSILIGPNGHWSGECPSSVRKTSWGRVGPARCAWRQRFSVGRASCPVCLVFSRRRFRHLVWSGDRGVRAVLADAQFLGLVPPCLGDAALSFLPLRGLVPLPLVLPALLLSGLYLFWGWFRTFGRRGLLWVTTGGGFPVLLSRFLLLSFGSAPCVAWFRQREAELESSAYCPAVRAWLGKLGRPIPMKGMTPVRTCRPGAVESPAPHGWSGPSGHSFPSLGPA